MTIVSYFGEIRVGAEHFARHVIIGLGPGKMRYDASYNTSTERPEQAIVVREVSGQSSDMAPLIQPAASAWTGLMANPQITATMTILFILPLLI